MLKRIKLFVFYCITIVRYIFFNNKKIKTINWFNSIKNKNKYIYNYLFIEYNKISNRKFIFHELHTFWCHVENFVKFPNRLLKLPNNYNETKWFSTWSTEHDRRKLSLARNLSPLSHLYPWQFKWKIIIINSYTIPLNIGHNG